MSEQWGQAVQQVKWGFPTIMAAELCNISNRRQKDPTDQTGWATKLFNQPEGEGRLTPNDRSDYHD